MADPNFFIKRIRDRWGGDPAEALCLAILQYMLGQPSQKLSMLTFADFISIAGRENVDGELMRAISILVSSVDALDTRYMFIDDDGEEFELDDEEIAEARKTGLFVHPETGRPVDEYERKLFPFFTPSRAFLQGRGADV